jgi:hypothetical protein
MLSTWRQKVQGDPAWRPSQRAYAAPQRIFTPAQEEQLIPKIRTEFLDKALYYCDEDFRIDGLRLYEEIRQDLENRALEDPVAQRRLSRLSIFRAYGEFSTRFSNAQPVLAPSSLLQKVMSGQQKAIGRFCPPDARTARREAA